MTELYPYKAGPIEPVCRMGDNVGIFQDKWIFAKVIYITPLSLSDPIMRDFGALAAGATSGNIQLTELDMHDLNFGQYRFQVADDITAELRQGAAAARFSNKNRIARVTAFTKLNDPCCHQTEFFVYENSSAYMQVTNETDYPLTQARVAFFGFKYICEAYIGPTPPAQYTRVPAAAFIQGGR